MATKTIGRCASCGYPIAAELEGQEVNCPMCQMVNEAILQEGVTIPTPLFVGLISFGLGMLIGPALIATTTEGQRWLERQIRRG